LIVPTIVIGPKVFVGFADNLREISELLNGQFSSITSCDTIILNNNVEGNLDEI